MIVASRFNDFVVESLIKGAVHCLKSHGAADADIELVRVPGAYEMPVVVDRIAASRRADGIIALGQDITDQLAAEEARDRTEREIEKLSRALTMGEFASTFAHEWGHAMHTVLANEAQPFETARYSTFIAETAAITKEVLAQEKLLRAAETEEERLFYLGYALEQMRGTYFRQTQFAEFEAAI